jgi:hypothetical protein
MYYLLKKLNDAAFLSHSVRLCSCACYNKLNISLKSIKWLLLVMEAQCVHCELGLNLYMNSGLLLAYRTGFL